MEKGTKKKTSAKSLSESRKLLIELKKSQEEYRAAMEKVNDAIVIVRGDKLLYCNKKYLAMLGYEDMEEIPDGFAFAVVHPDDREKVIEYASKRQKGWSAPLKYTIRAIRKDGSVMHVEISSSLITYEGKPASMGYIRDITEQVRAEERLRESEKTLWSLINASNEALLLTDTEGTILVTNETFARRLGKKLSDLIGTNQFDHFPPDVAANRKKHFDEVVKTGKAVHFEDTRAGMLFDIYGYPVFDDAGKVTKIAIFAIDITEHRKTESLLARKTEEINRFFETGLDLFCIADTEGCFRQLNRQWEKALGYRLDELEGRRFLDLVHPDDLEATLAAVKELAEDKEVLNFVNRYRCKDGSYRWIEWRSQPYGNLIYAAARDITERKEIEKALQDNEEKYRALFEHANDAIFLMKGDVFVDCNTKALEMFRCKREEIIGQSPYRFSPVLQPDGQASKEEALKKIRAALNHRSRSFEWQHCRCDGTLFDAEVSLNRLVLGGETFVQAIVRDVTDRKQAERALRESEEKYRNIFEHAVEGFFQSTPEGRFLSVNPAMAHMCGYDSPEEMITAITDIGQQFYVYPHERELYKKELEEYGKSKHFEHQVYRKDGVPMWISTNTRVVRDEAGNILYYEGTHENITERKMVEETLRGERERFRILSENAPFGLALVNEAGDFTFVNTKFVELFGYTLEEVPNGRTWFRKAYPDDAYRHTVIAAWLQDIEEKGPYEIMPRVFTVRCKDGTDKVINFRPVQLSSGETIMSCEDITERVRMDEEIRSSHQRLVDIIEFLPDATFVIDRKKTVIAWNRAMEEMTGIQKEDIIGKGDYAYALPLYGQRRPLLLDFLDKPDEKFMQHYRSVKQVGHTLYAEGFVPEVYGGKGAYFSAVASPLFDKAGNLAGAIESIRDITDRVETEEKLKTINKQLEDIIEFLPDATFIIDRDKKIIAWNRAIEEMTGVSKKDIIGKGHLAAAVPFYGSERPYLADLVEVDDAELAIKYDYVRRRGNVLYAEVFAPVLYNNKGGYIWVTASPLLDSEGKTIGIIESIRDITEQKMAERSLRTSEEKYRNIFENAVMGIFQTTPGGRYINANAALAKLFGFDTPEELITSITDIEAQEYVNKEDRNRLKYLLETQGFVQGFETELYRKDRSTIWISMNARAVRDETGAILYHEGTTEDITERKRAEAERRLNEFRLEALLRLHQMADAGMAEIVYFVLEEAVRLTESTIGYIAFANEDESMLTMYAWSRAAMEECRVADKPITYPVAETGLWGEAVRQRRPVITNDYAAPNPLKKGMPEGHVDVKRHMNVPVFDGDRIVMVAGVGNKQTNYDESDVHQLTLLTGGMWQIIKRKQAEKEKANLESQLLQLQKMEAIGTLAGGIAHDFNNLLMGILGYTSLMLMDTDTDHPHYEKLKTIEQQVQSGANLTKQLLGFARGGKYEVKPTDLNNLITRTSDMFGRAKRELSIHRKLQDGLYTAEVDRGQIEQVLLNLYVNAWHAMPTGGELHLETQNVIFNENNPAPYNLASGKYVRIIVTDTGIGMDEATQQRIFEPFFTTKEMGRGTGLGLASAYGIIKNHGGSIQVSSEKGKGTSFTIHLPASDKMIVEEKMAPGKIVRGRETVLLIDDQETVLDVGKAMLEELGYVVATAKSGSEALDFYKGHPGEINLVILDMIMPGMSGGEVYDRLKDIDPGVKVILSSGYSMDGQATGILERGCNGFIQKPFNMNTLSTKIREVLAL